jgi:CheY-like chemotaxis protein
VTQQTSVVVVDDDEINRAGIVALLAGDPDITVAGSFCHTTALSCPDLWPTVDVVLLDAADERRADDQFPGVEVVRRIRALGHTPVVVVITGHFVDDALRHRMREARADFFFHRGQLTDARTLRAVARNPAAAARPVPPPRDPEALFRLGVTGRTRVNAAVAYAAEHDLPTTLARRDEPRSRAWTRLRRSFNDTARLTVVTADGRVPDREQHLPSVRQIGKFLTWATRVKTR